MRPCAQNDTACVDACLLTYDQSFSKFYALNTCAAILCPLPCGPEAPDPCGTCQHEECGDAEMACDSDHDCRLLGRCVARCGSNDAMCQPACRAKYPKAVSLLVATLLCVQARCPVCL